MRCLASSVTPRPAVAPTGTGDDRDPTAVEDGWKQAELLAERLGAEHAERAVASPYLRCRQTLEPLARATDSNRRGTRRLAEGGRFEHVLELLTSLPDGAVLCSHGDHHPRHHRRAGTPRLAIETARLAQGHRLDDRAHRHGECDPGRDGRSRRPSIADVGQVSLSYS